MSNKRVVTLGEVLPERQTIGASHNSLSAFLFDGSDLHCSQAYDIAHIVDRVGSGDAFAAGLIYGLLHKMAAQGALAFATAASCLKHTIVGDVNRVSAEEVQHLLSHGGRSRVQC